jgi:hypothetical protein
VHRGSAKGLGKREAPGITAQEKTVSRKGIALGVAAALGAFLVSGPLQHVGVLPKTVVGDASNTVIKMALDFNAPEAFGSCGGGGGGGGGGSHPKGNNGWGNGENFAPGNSLTHQPKFEDPNTGPTPSHSPRSGGGDR